MSKLQNALHTFQVNNHIFGKGQLSAVLQITVLASKKEFPLAPKDFLTKSGGQVAKLSGANCNKILQKHGVTQSLASEAGRTSRGTINLMENYVSFLNTLKSDREIDFPKIEDYWVERIIDFFHNQPFVLASDVSQSVSTNLNDLFAQAVKRQKENPGTQYLGTMLQHLVAAKLQLIMPEGTFETYGASVADAPTERGGDFVINNTTIHCTTAPGSPLIEKCKRNIQSGYHPVIITIFNRVETALNLAADSGLTGRVEVWDIQQFLSANVYEHSLFDEAKRKSTLSKIIARYNTIVLESETDPSLRIEFETR